MKINRVKLKHALLEAGLSQKALANKLNVSTQFLWYLQTGQRRLSERHLKAICAELRVSSDWLCEGSDAR